MKTNDAIEVSKHKAVTWGNLLLVTFQQLGITDNEVIQNCHVGRSTFYRMKQGKLINVDAYLRMTNYGQQQIHSKEYKFSPEDRKTWEIQLLKILF